MMILFSVIPIFCALSILPEFVKLGIFLWEVIWLPLLPYLFIISYSLFTSLAIGALIILFYNSGISEYEQMFLEPAKKQILLNVKILEIFLFGFFFFLDFTNFPVIDFFYMFGFMIMIFISIINFFRGKSMVKNFKSHFFGYFIAVVFIGSNVLFSSSLLSEFLRIWSLIISAILYIFVFFYTFLKNE